MNMLPYRRLVYWYGFGPLVILEERVTANQYTGYFYPMMKHFNPPVG